MSSKNLLLLGSLLFLLLVTVCSVFFLDKYNPLMQSVTESEPITTTPADLFPQEIPIATASQTVVNTSLPEKNITTAPAEPEVPAKHEANTTDQTPSLHTVAPKIDRTKIPAATLRKPKIPEQPLPAIAESKTTPEKIKKRVIQPKYSTLEVTESSQSIYIEPVILNKTLHVSESGNLHRWDKTFLNDLAKRIKRGQNLILKVNATTPVTSQKRKYMQNIRRYLISRGVPSRKIKLIILKRTKGHEIIITDNRKEKIELALIERI